jgi:hypothetical protein
MRLTYGTLRDNMFLQVTLPRLTNSNAINMFTDKGFQILCIPATLAEAAAVCIMAQPRMPDVDARQLNHSIPTKQGFAYI